MQNHGEGRSLLLELGMWLALCAGMFLVASNLDGIRGYLSGAVIAELERNAPANPARPSRKAAQTDGEQAERSSGGDGVEIRANSQGHYDARIEINGRTLDALVDTGATMVMLTYEDARRAGIYLRPQDFTLTTQTANGTARAAPVMLDRVELGNIRVRNVRAAVAEPGRLGVNLLGMSFLQRLQKFEIRSGRLLLQD